MNPIRAYLEGWKAVFRNGRMWLALYLFNVLLALLAAFPFSGYLGKTIGQSLELQRSLSGFNYTFATDFLREYGQGLSGILDASLGFTGLYLLVSIALTGGILLVFRHFSGPFQWAVFRQGCARFFWRLLRLTLYFALLHISVLALFGGLFYLATGGLSIFQMETELELVRPLYFILPIYLLVAAVFFMVQDYAKVHIVQADESLLTRPIRQAFGLAFRNFGPFFLLYLLNIASLLVLFGIYWWISSRFQATSGGTIAGLFLLGQAFVAGRIGLRLLNLGSATYLYQKATIPHHDDLTPGA